MIINAFVEVNCFRPVIINCIGTYLEHLGWLPFRKDVDHIVG